MPDPTESPDETDEKSPKDPKPPKTVTIVVNGVQHIVEKKDELTFDEVVDLAFNPRPTGPNWYFTVGYRRGHGNKPEGSLIKGQSVTVKDGMVFNVTATDKS
ncbi:MAG TPA: multiubiquitin domain-containing protein [Nocardioides sp.]